MSGKWKPEKRNADNGQYITLKCPAIVSAYAKKWINRVQSRTSAVTTQDGPAFLSILDINNCCTAIESYAEDRSKTLRTTLYPTVFFKAICRCRVESAGNAELVAKVERLIIYATPTRASHSHSLRRLGLPGILIEEHGTEPISVVELSPIGTETFCEHFKKSTQGKSSDLEEYYTSLCTRTKEEIDRANSVRRKLVLGFANKIKSTRPNDAQILAKAKEGAKDSGEALRRGRVALRCRDKLDASISDLLLGTNSPFDSVLYTVQALKKSEEHLGDAFYRYLTKDVMSGKVFFAIDRSGLHVVSGDTATTIVNKIESRMRSIPDSTQFDRIERLFKDYLPYAERYYTRQAFEQLQRQLKETGANESTRKAKIKEAIALGQKYDKLLPPIPKKPVDPLASKIATTRQKAIEALNRRYPDIAKVAFDERFARMMSGYYRYKAELKEIQDAFNVLLSRHRLAASSGKYDSDPEWKRYKRELATWNVKDAERQKLIEQRRVRIEAEILKAKLEWQERLPDAMQYLSLLEREAERISPMIYRAQRSIARSKYDPADPSDKKRIYIGDISSYILPR